MKAYIVILPGQIPAVYTTRNAAAQEISVSDKTLQRHFAKHDTFAGEHGTVYSVEVHKARSKARR